jgi:rhodanese-related sulfurtransferase
MRKMVLILLALQGIVFGDFTQDTLISWMSNGAPFDFILIDLRGTSDNITKVIGNDKCTPYNLVWQDEFTQNISKIGKDQHVVVYCQSGGRAASATSYLLAQGYQYVYNAGGFSAWKGSTKDYTGSECLPDSMLPVPSMIAKTSRAVIAYKKNTSTIKPPNVFVNVTNNNYLSFENIFTVSGQSLGSNYKIAKGIYYLRK